MAQSFCIPLTEDEPRPSQSQSHPYVRDLELRECDSGFSTMRSIEPTSQLACDESHSSSLSGSHMLTTKAPEPLLLYPEDSSAAPVIEETPVGYPAGLRLFVITLSLMFAVLLVVLDLTIVATAIPKITDEFHGLRDVSWYSAAFFITTSSFQSTWGKAFKHFPLKTAFLLSLAIFETGSLLCGVAPTSIAFIIGRAIAGVGAAGVASGVYIIAGYSVTPQRRPAYTGIIGASFGLASVLGPLLGGVFSETIGWRWCFYINLPIGGLSFFIILLLFQAPASAKPKTAPLIEKLLQLDLGGTSILLGSLISFLLALQYGGQLYPWTSARVIGLLAGSAALLVIFGLWEYWQDERAMMPPRLMRMRTMFVTGMVNLFLAGSYLVVVYFLPVYFQSIQGTSPIESSVRNLPLILSVIIGTISAGVFVTATGVAAPLLLGSAAVATIGVGLCYTLDMNTTQPHWIGVQVLAGFPLGIGFQLPVIIAQASAPPADISPATTMQLFFQLVGGALFVTAGESAFVNRVLTILPSTAPTVPPELVIATGAGALRQTFSPDVLDGILLAYIGGIKAAFAIAIVGAGVSLLIGTHMSMKRLNTDIVKEQAGAA
ncbi:major facilitator superfamily domain-containing protein [Xylariaceae sp. AK1471]|nr:major facilitator superfamily domain-containing protein [Xylariaceae sp. AK1471]